MTRENFKATSLNEFVVETPDKINEIRDFRVFFNDERTRGAVFDYNIFKSNLHILPFQKVTAPAQGLIFWEGLGTRLKKILNLFRIIVMKYSKIFQCPTLQSTLIDFM